MWPRLLQASLASLFPSLPPPPSPLFLLQAVIVKVSGCSRKETALCTVGEGGQPCRQAEKKKKSHYRLALSVACILLGLANEK